MSVLPRLPHTVEAKRAISAALTGRKLSQATKDAIAAAMTGRKHTEATKAKLRAARAKRPPLMEAARAATRARHAAASKVRIDQWRRDKYAALRMKARALFEDVKRSEGWRNKRKLFDKSGKVSDGIPSNRP